MSEVQKASLSFCKSSDIFSIHPELKVGDTLPAGSGEGENYTYEVVVKAGTIPGGAGGNDYRRTDGELSAGTAGR